MAGAAPKTWAQDTATVLVGTLGAVAELQRAHDWLARVVRVGRPCSCGLTNAVMAAVFCCSCCTKGRPHSQS